MKNQRFWVLPWLCLCLNFGLTGCKSLEMVRLEPVYKVQFALAPVVDETTLGSLFAIGHLSDIDINHSMNDGRTVWLLIHGENALRVFKQEIAQAGLPVVALKITSVQDY